MHKLLMTTTLLTAVSASALAAYPQAHSELTPRFSVSNGARHRLSGMLPRQIKRGEVSDPYWSPCDYSDDWSGVPIAASNAGLRFGCCAPRRHERRNC
jgi:hypothetical protein